MRNLGKLLILCSLSAVLICSFAACTQAYAEDGYTVRFEFADGNSRPYAVITNDDGSITRPDLPVRKGYTFAGWFTEKDGQGTEVTFPYTPSGDTTLYAAWAAKVCTVTLDYHFDGKVETVEANYGTVFKEPAFLERKNFTLFSWHKDSLDGSVVKFPITVKNDITLVADWVSTAGVYTVIFDMNCDGAEPAAEKTVVEGKSIKKSELPEPTRTGYKLKGWSLTPGGKALKFPYKPVENCTLYAIWQEVTNTVVFWTNYVDNNSLFETKTSGAGAPIDKPAADPERENYSFAGWYASTEGGNPVEFPYTPTKDTRIYAHWKHDPVITDIFHAEYVEFDPNELFPGYSGENRGKDIIGSTNDKNILIDNDLPLSNSQLAAGHKGYYVTYLYKRGATLRFVINSSEDVAGATLKVSAAIEGQASATFGPAGENAWKVTVNGDALNYTPITMSITGAIQPSSTSDFQLFTLGNVSLKKGENVIELITDNDSPVIGGTTRANAPMVDYIQLANYGSAVLSWSPVYDNLYK